MGLIEATRLAAKVRLRPIVMTSLAFGFGVLPLAIATGAGAGAQTAIGTSVLGGMLSGTFLAVLFIPLFFVVIVQLFSRRRAAAPGSARHDSGPHGPSGGGEMNMRTPIVFVAAALALAGCTMIPKYERPPLPVPDEFPAPAGAEADGARPAGAATAPGWQEYFADARLRTVIERALADNRDLRIAALNVEQAAALLPDPARRAQPHHRRPGRRPEDPAARADDGVPETPRRSSSTRSRSASCPGRSTCSGACAA